jgi:molybdopterin converting factor small subunit
MIVLSISKNLTRVTKGDEAFEVEGETLGDCLNDLVSIVPRIKDELFVSSGDRLLGRVQVKVNRRIIDGEDSLATKIEDGDEIDIALKGHR